MDGYVRFCRNRLGIISCRHSRIPQAHWCGRAIDQHDCSAENRNAEGAGYYHIGRVTIKERPLNTEEAFYEHMQMMRDDLGTAIDQIITAGLDHLIMGISLQTF